MEIREITGDKRRYLPLLLVGDEQEEMVMRYLPHGSLFVCFDPDPCAVAVVTDRGRRLLRTEKPRRRTLPPAAGPRPANGRIRRPPLC